MVAEIFILKHRSYVFLFSTKKKKNCSVTSSINCKLMYLSYLKSKEYPWRFQLFSLYMLLKHKSSHIFLKIIMFLHLCHQIKIIYKTQCTETKRKNKCQYDHCFSWNHIINIGFITNRKMCLYGSFYVNIQILSFRFWYERSSVESLFVVRFFPFKF